MTAGAFGDTDALAVGGVMGYPRDDPEAILDEAQRCLGIARGVHELATGLGRAAAVLEAQWQGPAATGCVGEIGQAVGLVDRAAEAVGDAAEPLRAHATVVRAAREEIDGLRRHREALVVEHARSEAVREQSSAVLPGQVRLLLAEQARGEHCAELARLSERHRLVLDRVSRHAVLSGRQVALTADAVVPRPRAGGARVGGAESAIAATLPMLAAVRRAAGLGGSPPVPGASPPDVQDWWAAMTGDERSRAVRSWPGQIGAMAGLPSSIRSVANELLLQRDVTYLRALLRRSADEQRWLANCLVVSAQLRAMRASGAPTSSGASNRAGRAGATSIAQLLAFDPRAYDGLGRAVLAVGDLDAADNVAFLVPGFGSSLLSSMGGLTGDARQVVALAGGQSPTRSTAVVAWLGYRAPGWKEVPFAGAAVAGAELLARDVTAVAAARAFPAHLTLVGHSYGSTTTGTALRAQQLGVDDVVLLGSPGPNVTSASRLQVPPAHVFVGASSRDPVSYLDRFGSDPALDSFGAVRFRAEDVRRNPGRLDVDDHSRYFAPGSESLANVVRVVTGDYDAVTMAPHREERLLRVDGINSDPEARRVPGR